LRSDKNGDGVVDHNELVAILTRGNGLHRFNDKDASKVSDQIIDYWCVRPRMS
jgi:hypothetical protein